MCGSSWVRNEQNMCCTELCPCQGSDFCMNRFSRSRENDRDSEGDEENDADQKGFHYYLALELNNL